MGFGIPGGAWKMTRVISYDDHVVPKHPGTDILG